MEDSQVFENIDKNQDSKKSKEEAQRFSEQDHSNDSSTQDAGESAKPTLEEQLKAQENKFLYLYADFENYKKRSIKERSDWMKYGWERVARDLIGVLDNLDRALNHLPEGTDQSLETGLKMVRDQFLTSLERNGVKPIVSLNQLFNAEFHEAINYEPSDQPEGTVIQEEQKGYLLHDRLLRPARVIVSKGKT